MRQTLYSLLGIERCKKKLRYLINLIRHDDEKMDRI